MCLSIMANIEGFKTEGGIEATADKFGKMMVEMKKLDLANILDFIVTLQL